MIRAAGRPLTLGVLLSLAAAPMVAQQQVQSTPPPAAPAPATPAPTTPAPQPSSLYAQPDEHPATIAAAKEENAKAMSRNHTVTYSTTVLILVIIILVLLI
jgi:hypothetical protein